VTQSKGKNNPAGAAERHQARLYEIDAGETGQRVDNVLLRLLKSVPKSRIYAMVRKGEVRLDGGRVKVTTRVAAGQKLRIPPHQREVTETPVVPRAVRTRLEAAVIFEDRDLLVLAKPPGFAAHGGSGVRFGVLEALSPWPEAPALALAHRLDRDTSGVLVLAKRRAALRYLQAAFRERHVTKRYLAVVAGAWPRTLRRLEAPLERVLAANGERFVRVAQAGKPARTEVTLGERLATATVLQLMPETGRTHQLRVHLAHAGFPILGDEKYAPPELRTALGAVSVPRLALHAHALTIPHRDPEQPPWRFEAPLPDDLAALIKALRQAS
jgi:23S rRNA pseudouridine955/2504/2580 synthase